MPLIAPYPAAALRYYYAPKKSLVIIPPKTVPSISSSTPSPRLSRMINTAYFSALNAHVHRLSPFSFQPLSSMCRCFSPESRPTTCLSSSTICASNLTICASSFLIVPERGNLYSAFSEKRGNGA
jgi:hypothetical protein